MTTVLPRCHFTVWWFDLDMSARCLRADGHLGAHRDGARWWDRNGLAVDGTDHAAARPVRRHPPRPRVLVVA